MFVKLEHAGQSIEGMIAVASANEGSLMVMYDGMFMGYVGMMPLLMNEDGDYVDLIQGRAVSVTVLVTERANQ